MKVIDLVKQSFFKYPTLYATSDNFEDIKFAVLHHNLIVLGNGIEWAHTKDPKQAGYLIEPKFVKRNDEWKRTYDLPYGKLKIDIDIEPYLKNTRYELSKINHEETKRWQKFGMNSIHSMSRSEYERPSKILFIESEFKLLPPKTILPGGKYDKKKDYYLRTITDHFFEGEEKRRNPYPNFQKQYSCFYEKGIEYIQDDWRKESIEHLEYWQKWFTDTEKIKTYSNYPKKNKKDDTEFLNMLKKQVADGQKLESVCKNYRLKTFNLNDKAAYDEATTEKWKKEEKEIKSFLSETITKLKK